MSQTPDLRNILQASPRYRVGHESIKIANSDMGFRSWKVNDREKGEFCLQLSVMLQSKVSLHRALQVLAKQTTNRKLKGVIERLMKEIQTGNSFGAALAKQPDVFDSLFVASADVGQESGRLPEVFSHLAHHLEKSNALKRKISQALTYPVLVIVVAIFAVMFLLVFIVPAFTEMFKSFQVELPFATRIILMASSNLIHYGAYLLLLASIALLAFGKSINRPKVRERLIAHALNIPVIGNILLKNHMARFCRTLGTLLQSQVSLLTALGVTQRIMPTPELRDETKDIIAHVRRGKTVAAPLVDSKLFPPMVAQMIAVGEETSELDSMLLKVADYYEKEVDGKVDSLSSLLEPVIILFLGLVVAGILISMYLPMFDLVNVAGAGQ